MEYDASHSPEQHAPQHAALIELVSRALASDDIGAALVASERFTREEKLACMFAEPAHFAPTLASDEYYEALSEQPEIADAVYRALIMRNSHLRKTPHIFEQQMRPYHKFLALYETMRAPSSASQSDQPA